MKLSRFAIIGSVVVALLIVAILVGLWQLRPRTRYAPGFTEDAFARIQPGASAADVIGALGEPLSRRAEIAVERWCYGPWPDGGPRSERGLLWAHHEFDLNGPPCLEFGADGRAVKSIRDREGKLKAAVGESAPRVRELLGAPHHIEPPGTFTVLFYSALDGDDGSYEVRSVVLSQDDRVVERVAYTLWD